LDVAMSEARILVLFWAACGVCLYTYVVYPLLLRVLTALFGRPAAGPPAGVAPAAPAGGWPRVSILIPAFDEELVIAAKLENSLALDYPAERLEIVVGSDGSSDGTEAIVEEWARRDGRVRLRALRPRRGKPAVINRLMPELTGEYVVLTDANTMFAPDLVKRLVARLADDPGVGAAVGEMRLISPDEFRTEGLYWRYEVYLKQLEDRLGAVLGANGGNYAIRRASYEPIPDETWVDDFVIPLLITARRGLAVRYDPHAVASEDTTRSVEAEFVRKSRIGAGNYQALVMLRCLLDPRHGWISFSFWSHKVLRWMVPGCLLVMLPASVVLARGRPAFGLVVAAQAALYGLALWGILSGSRSRWRRLWGAPCYFVVMNLALANGFWRWLTGRQRATWERTQRLGPPAQAGHPGSRSERRSREER